MQTKVTTDTNLETQLTRYALVQNAVQGTKMYRQVRHINRV